jgi:NAD(P)-dependent dehydrogenase (short-subunit alcohol dehydrogenase family)
MRGSAHFAAFAAAKGGLRQVAQSMARELGPRGLHVAHVVIDGRIAKGEPADGMLATDAIAELYWQIHAQPRSAWTFEADLRPWAERF